MMPNPAFLIEGFMEKKIIQALCPGVTVRRIGCNGDDVEMSVVANFVDTQIRLLGNRHYPIIIVLDRERRHKSVETLCNELFQALQELGHGSVDFRIAIADRTTENWIMADIGNVNRRFDLQVPQRDFDGQFGKSVLARYLKDRVSYHETTHGVELFRTSDPEQMKANSQNFNAFAALIDFDCDWLGTAT